MTTFGRPGPAPAAAAWTTRVSRTRTTTAVRIRIEFPSGGGFAAAAQPQRTGCFDHRTDAVGFGNPSPMPRRPARKLMAVALASAVIGLAAAAVAQFRGRRMPVYGDGPIVGPVDRGNVPTWPIDK